MNEYYYQYIDIVKVRERMDVLKNKLEEGGNVNSMIETVREYEDVRMLYRIYKSLFKEE